MFLAKGVKFLKKYNNFDIALNGDFIERTTDLNGLPIMHKQDIT